MTPEVKRTPRIKARPWWVRFAEAPNGWIIVQCSFLATHIEKGVGRVWEGPKKIRRCVFGYGWQTAQSSPALILYNTRTGSIEEIVATLFNRPLSDDLWSRIAEGFWEWTKNWSPDTPEDQQKEAFVDRIKEIISGPDS